MSLSSGRASADSSSEDPKPAGQRPEAGSLGLSIARHWREILVAGVFVAIPVAMVYFAFDYNPEARRLPIVVGVPLSVVAAINFVLVVLRARPGARQPEEHDDLLATAGSKAFEQAAEQAVSESTTGDNPDQLSPPMAVLSFVALCALVFTLGLVLSIPVFTVAFMRIVGRHPWLRSILLAAGTMALIVVLSTFLDVDVYEGLFGGFLPF